MKKYRREHEPDDYQIVEEILNTKEKTNSY